jgi:hypothetical protein
MPPTDQMQQRRAAHERAAPNNVKVHAASGPGTVALNLDKTAEYMFD